MTRRLAACGRAVPNPIVHAYPAGATMKLDRPRYVLKFSCYDTIGIVHAISGFLTQNGCNIVTSSQFGDRETERFFMRVAFAPLDPPHAAPGPGGPVPAHRRALRDGLEHARRDAPDPRCCSWCRASGTASTTCSTAAHRRAADGRRRASCRTTGLRGPRVEAAGIPFHHLPVTRTPRRSRRRALRDRRSRPRASTWSSSPATCRCCRTRCASSSSGRAINIHHSFLPSFKGARPTPRPTPRRQAHRRHRPLRHPRPRRGPDHRAGGAPGQPRRTPPTT